MNRFLLAALTSTALLVPATSAFAAPGDLDTSFSGDGRELVDLGGEDHGATAVTQPDGKIVFAATTGASPQGDFVVGRRNRDGSPDKTFSDDGQIRFGFNKTDTPTNDRAMSVALGPDGSIVVAGFTDANAGTGAGNDTAVARVTSSGALDSTFNGTGKATVDFGQGDVGTDVAVRPDGSVVVGEIAHIGSDDDFGVAQLTPGGKPDTSWSGDGRASAHFGANEILRAIALTPDGGVVAVGRFQNVSTSFDTAVARFRSDGNIDDTGFAGRGKLIVSFGGKDFANDVAVQPDGKLVLPVVDVTQSDTKTMVARLTSTGGRDSDFGEDGVTVVPAVDSALASVALTPSNRIVAAGQVGSGSQCDFLLVELNPDGELDRAFAAGAGHARYDVGSLEFAQSVAISGQRAVISGFSGTANVPLVAVEIDEPQPPQPQGQTEPEPQPAPAADSPPAEAPQALPSSPLTGPADALAPVLSKLKLKTTRGTEKATYRLSEQATVKVTVQRKVKRGTRTRLVAARKVTLKGKAGGNAFKLKNLKPGSYRVTLKATDGAGNRSKALRASFVLKARSGAR